ncbi:nucleoside 2-deoxyribosyltransferase [Leuconostoc mesenteroides]|uniref:nucleoside 2-deoxyribosyltransferase n=1 Tax=Leuconostoc mesenteroides TaxID=1245 RepID=UPI0029436F1B|nr:nucleoside 2-deoxyribosyltransferase [Leuconostoc mesenteroides]
MNQRVFLAAPFKQLLNQNNRVNTETTQALQQVMQVLEDKGMFVDNAHKRENWGLEMMTSTQCTDADFNSIKNCDILMAFPGSPASPGTHIEIGWASAFHKKIILLLKNDVDYAYLIRGLGVIGDVEYIYYEDMNSCLSQISNVIDNYLQHNKVLSK